MKFIAKTLHGLEEVLAAELAALGADNIQPLTRAVAFEGDKALMYRANLQLRTALRILVPLFEFDCKNEKTLYHGIRNYGWHQHLTPKQTLAIDAFSSSDLFTHTHFLALKSKDAIVDQLRKHYKGQRPNIDTQRPDLRINIHIRNTTCTVALDSSAYSLHKRGYRIQAVKAPMNELLAAGILLLAGWPNHASFYDPMCGSGTLAIEAGLIAANRSPQLITNRFGFLRWNDFDQTLWQSILKEAKEGITKIDQPIYCSDISDGALRISRINARKAGLDREIRFSRQSFMHGEPPGTPGLMIMNPPYDERLPLEKSEAFYKSIGDQLKQSYAGYEAWILSANLPAIKRLGLRPSRKISLFNGQLESKLMKYELYAGSKKAKYQS